VGGRGNGDVRGEEGARAGAGEGYGDERKGKRGYF